MAELIYRLAVIPIDVPPLRDRPADILPLIKHFAARTATALGRPPVLPMPAQEERILSHTWPGNIRELANLVERAGVRGVDAYDDLPPARSRPGVDGAIPSFSPGFDLSAWLEETERALLVRAIEEARGDRARMCMMLGLERNTLRYKLKKYGLLGLVESGG